ncbi:MAG: iron-sulfur cluster-binding protein, partial [Planctomycetes bacterium]|nr:iron-sulfur cluster-binding protein [Planctomycetota bacterium]
MSAPGAFPAAVRDALGDAALGRALRTATDTIHARRGAAVAATPEWQALRARASAIKREALATLDVQLERFEAAATAAGTRVHWARDAAEANDVVARIVRAAGGRLVVKSKSMTTEETGLNAALEAAGARVVETDLGEYIVQVAREAPSHIIVPAIHKSRGEIGALFERELDSDAGDDPQALTAFARVKLREEFARADVGVSGANFLVAETGSFLVLENEGNARLTTSLPRVHVAVVGIEKVVPQLADLDVFLRLLPRSGTGQRLTSYQTLFTGPTPAGGEGPEALHVVLVDNGRSALLRDELTRSALGCIRCGACLNACPVYGAVGGHAYGSVYPGPIGAVITPLLGGLERAGELPFASSLCGACQEVCPVGIDLPALLLALRGRVRAAGSRRGAAGAIALWAFFTRTPRRYALLNRL